MPFREICLIVTLGIAGLCSAAESVGIATIVDGEATLVRRTVKFALKPGVRLDEQDLVETGSKTGIVRLELTSGVVADLGPGTRVILSPKLGSGSGGRQAALYAVNGWVKTGSEKYRGDGTAALVLSASLDVSKATGSTVLNVQTHASQVFSESGTVVVTERRQGRSMPSVTLKPGSFISWNKGAKANVSPTPPASFMREVPKAFRDNIPAMASRFKAGAIPPAKALGDLGYPEALPWLGTERDVRALLVTIWKPYLNRDLRTGLASHIRSHPEWDPVLFPEKYLPAGTPAPVANR